MTRPITGRCMCGAVAYEAEAMKDEIDACHCRSCRRWSGHFWASVNAHYSSLKIPAGEDKVKWYRSSDIVRRGFCSECGSTLFWHPDRHEKYSGILGISAGSLDEPTGVKLALHIFVAEKGDYYELNDGLPQREGH